MDSFHRQRQTQNDRRAVGKSFADGVIDKRPLDGHAVANRAAFAGLESADYFFTAAVVFHGAGFGFGVGQDAAIGRDDGDAGAAFGGVGNPTVQHGNLVGRLRRKGRYGKRMNVDQADQRLQFVVSVIFVAGAEGALGQKIHGQQGAG